MRHFFLPRYVRFYPKLMKLALVALSASAIFTSLSLTHSRSIVTSANDKNNPPSDEKTRNMSGLIPVKKLEQLTNDLRRENKIRETKNENQNENVKKLSQVSMVNESIKNFRGKKNFFAQANESVRRRNNDLTSLKYSRVRSITDKYYLTFMKMEGGAGKKDYLAPIKIRMPSANENEKVPLRKDRLLILHTSLGRVGSSWVSEILAQANTEVLYLFEPLKVSERLYNKSMEADTAVAIISSLFNCEFSKEMYKLMRTWKLLYKLPNLDQIPRFNSTYIINDLPNICRSASIIIIKDIRMSVASTEHLLASSALRELRIIYQVRDPRAQLTSWVKNKMEFMINSTALCSQLDKDLSDFSKLSQKFPKNFYFVRYEDLCRSTADQLQKLWNFIRSGVSEPLPEPVSSYIESHNSNIQKQSYSTYRIKELQWSSWRNDRFSVTVLKEVEAACSASMRMLGYLKLTEERNVRNLSIPSVERLNCSYFGREQLCS
ncbi:carbohydrate sulfotransferase 4-like [Hyalella azteca]|uniref:Carbohydrate sulfotransferase 4-like n=1 Tax=Hyalella azteca TaxID=294128 RepID=A0A979FTY9_HYAAZ|nr:carbohydrate sulfotransferase 4-like [Hyalella azteca]